MDSPTFHITFSFFFSCSRDNFYTGLMCKLWRKSILIIYLQPCSCILSLPLLEYFNHIFFKYCWTYTVLNDEEFFDNFNVICVSLKFYYSLHQSLFYGVYYSTVHIFIIEALSWTSQKCKTTPGLTSLTCGWGLQMLIFRWPTQWNRCH